MFKPNHSSSAMFTRRELMPKTTPDISENGNPHPAAYGPRIFADSAVRSELEPLLEAGILNGLTTNPTLLKKAGATSWRQAKEMMSDLCSLFHPNPVSLDLTEIEENAMLAQAEEDAKAFQR